jgi:hypothetical protein
MARYRSKDETDLAWNRIRRSLTREIDTELQNRREEALNTLLTKAWTDYVEAVGQGTVPEVESRYTKLVSAVVKDVVPDVSEVAPDGKPALD